MKELDYLEIFARKPYKNFGRYCNEPFNYFVPKINNVIALDKLEFVI